MNLKIYPIPNQHNINGIYNAGDSLNKCMKSFIENESNHLVFYRTFNGTAPATANLQDVCGKVKNINFDGYSWTCDFEKLDTPYGKLINEDVKYMLSVVRSTNFFGLKEGDKQYTNNILYFLLEPFDMFFRVQITETTHNQFEIVYTDHINTDCDIDLLINYKESIKSTIEKYHTYKKSMNKLLINKECDKMADWILKGKTLHIPDHLNRFIDSVEEMENKNE